jgi:hypothetical protein
MKHWLTRIATWVIRIGADPDDEDDIRLQKSLLVVCAFPFMIAGVGWGLMYIYFREPLAAAIPLGYAVFVAQHDPLR